MVRSEIELQRWGDSPKVAGGSVIGSSVTRRLQACLAAVVFSATSVVVALTDPAATATALPVVQSTVTITAPDGTAISAIVARPAINLPYPLIVIPGHWGGKPATNIALASAGFEVVNYGQRGFGGSGGLVDFAGANTISDFETVLTWATRNTSVDRTHISAFGVSYGAATALLAAEQDPRVSAVVAISPWGIFSNVIAPGGAVNTLLPSVLLTHVDLEPDVASLRTSMISDHPAAVALAAQLGQTRSPLYGVASLNARNVPVLISASMQDSIAPASDVVALYNSLAGPKRLLMLQGDHNAVEADSAYGVNGPWFAADAWLLKYGAGRTVDAADLTPTVSVQLEETTSTVNSADWPGGVGATYALTGSGTAVSGPTVTWSHVVTQGVTTPADSGKANVTTTNKYVPPKISMYSVRSNAAVVWAAPAVSTATVACGSPTISFGVMSSVSTTPVFVYVEDVTKSNRARLLSATPGFLTGLTPGVMRPYSQVLRPICATLAAGDHLAVVVDTIDTRYPNPKVKATTTFSSSPAWPAKLSI